MNTEEKRKLKRWRLIYSLRVFERETDQLFGHLSNISDGGMQLVTEKAVDTDQDFNFWMEVQLESGEMKSVGLRAHSRWLNSDNDTGLYHAGFELRDIDPLLVVSIRCIIDELQLEV